LPAWWETKALAKWPSKEPGEPGVRAGLRIGSWQVDFFLGVIMEVNQNPMRNKSDDKPEPGFERSSESRRQHGQMILPSLENTKKTPQLRSSWIA
jgi:hypothetical protein